jgi:hypothetical protein
VESGVQSQVHVGNNEEFTVQAESVNPEIKTEESETAAADASEKIEIQFAGSETIRARFPKPFEVAEKIATDWVNDGRFEGLPLGHPLAEYFAAKGLRKAKEVEKKVLESPVTEKVALNVLTYGMKAQELLNQIKEKIKK